MGQESKSVIQEECLAFRSYTTTEFHRLHMGMVLRHNVSKHLSWYQVDVLTRSRFPWIPWENDRISFDKKQKSVHSKEIKSEFIAIES
mmetsp:Transcript_27140/g.39336  ORF Transcript_27140/g.39336 Transcript_27140/m.39336 type:complete len:88 (-) Transcript_27140:145-408(-)